MQGRETGVTRNFILDEGNGNSDDVALNLCQDILQGDGIGTLVSVIFIKISRFLLGII